MVLHVLRTSVLDLWLRHNARTPGSTGDRMLDRLRCGVAARDAHTDHSPTPSGIRDCQPRWRHAGGSWTFVVRRDHNTLHVLPLQTTPAGIYRKTRETVSCAAAILVGVGHTPSTPQRLTQNMSVMSGLQIAIIENPTYNRSFTVNHLQTNMSDMSGMSGFI